MSINEKLVTIESEVILTVDNRNDEIRRGLQLIADAFSEYLVGTELVHNTLGTGIVTGIDGGWDMNTMAVSIKFANEIRRFGLWAMTHSSACPIKITDEIIVGAVAAAQELYTKWHWQSVDLGMEASRIKRETEKEVEEAKKAELKYQRQKESSIKAFDDRVGRTRETSTVDEFYYAIGWLVSHMNSVSATLPDYLENAFKNHFGADTPCRVVDSQHRSPAGWQPQWSWYFKISLKKYDDIPSVLVPFLNPAGKDITNTDFVWDLVETYGFLFGKKQDIDEIEAHIPAEHFNSYLDGKA